MTNSPGVSLAERRPMCMGRSMYFVPSRSASSRRFGPRSTVKTVATIAATTATTTASRRSRHGEAALSRRRLRGLAATVPAVPVPASLPRLYSITTSTRPASTGVPGVTFDFPDPAGLRRAQLVLHLHRLDDDHALTRSDLVARR